MKILFLYPGMELTGRYKDVIKGVAVPPQGICQLAGVTRALRVSESAPPFGGGLS